MQQTNIKNKPLQEKDFASVLCFCRFYNTSYQAPRDGIVETFRKYYPKEAEDIAEVCNVSPAALNDDVIAAQPLLRICILLVGDATSFVRMRPVKMKSIAGILFNMDPATMPNKVSPALYAALTFNIYIQWRLIHMPGEQSAAGINPAWDKWADNHQFSNTTLDAVNMLFHLLNDAVTNQNQS